MAAQMWDAATGIRMGEAMRHSDKVERAEFSPDGTLILTASADHTARLWDAGTGRPVSDPLRHEAGLTVARFDGEASLAIIVARAEEAVRRGDRARAISLHQQLDVGRLQGTEALKQQVTAVPPRDPALSPRLVDLTSHYTNSLVAGAALPAPLGFDDVFERLPETFTPTNGIAFDLRGKVQLNSGPITLDNERPEERKDFSAITGTPLEMNARIPVGLTAQAVHFLHSTTCGYAPEGTIVAEYVIHFADLSQETVPVIIGTDIADCFVASSTRQIPAGLKGTTLE
ncbi:MAG: WD40 repeat domain-containing protein [Verrucomicrobiales bacterium]